ncbi:MAG: hypothetical protein M4579_000201 [Chaenotheca gracillima]|nr:MAG: hypothetical protein M4579_000201 [Chaenotheca gracillima]
MDLLSSIRKEGSRGGRANFQWSDVAADTHRENYLGHSLMAPVGRWQKNRDLSWYAKADDDADEGDQQSKEESARRAEIARIKEAENEALARALGHPIPSANQIRLGAGSPPGVGASEGDVRKAVKESGLGAHEDGDLGEDEGGVGVGFGAYEGGPKRERMMEAMERMGGSGPNQSGGQGVPDLVVTIPSGSEVIAVDMRTTIVTIASEMIGTKEQEMQGRNEKGSERELVERIEITNRANLENDVPAAAAAGAGPEIGYSDGGEVHRASGTTAEQKETITIVTDELVRGS